MDPWYPRHCLVAKTTTVFFSRLNFFWCRRREWIWIISQRKIFYWHSDIQFPLKSRASVYQYISHFALWKLFIFIHISTHIHIFFYYIKHSMHTFFFSYIKHCGRWTLRGGSANNAIKVIYLNAQRAKDHNCIPCTLDKYTRMHSRHSCACPCIII